MFQKYWISIYPLLWNYALITKIQDQTQVQVSQSHSPPVAFANLILIHLGRREVEWMRALFFKWGNWDPEMLSYLPKVFPGKRAGTYRKLTWHESSCSVHFSFMRHEHLGEASGTCKKKSNALAWAASWFSLEWKRSIFISLLRFGRLSYHCCYFYKITNNILVVLLFHFVNLCFPADAIYKMGWIMTKSSMLNL